MRDAGQTRCNGAQFQTCNASRTAFETTQTCASKAQCSVGGCQAPVCSPGQTQCNGAQFQTCNASGSAFVNTQTCASFALCDSVAGCQPPVCNAGETRCAGLQAQVCNADRTTFETTQTCPTSCDVTLTPLAATFGRLCFVQADAGIQLIDGEAER